MKLFIKKFSKTTKGQSTLQVPETRALPGTLRFSESTEVQPTHRQQVPVQVLQRHTERHTHVQERGPGHQSTRTQTHRGPLQVLVAKQIHTDRRKTLRLRGPRTVRLRGNVRIRT